MTAFAADAAEAAVASAGPRPAAAGQMLPAHGDLDPRLLPDQTLRRLALTAGLQPPIDEPLSAGQWRALLAVVAADTSALSEADRALARELAGRTGRARWWGGRVLIGYAERGRLVAQEAGLVQGPGLQASGELGAQLCGGRWWSALTVRATVRPDWLAGAPADPQEALSWPGWDPATGPGQRRRALWTGTGLDLDVVRAAVGVESGRWAIGIGWEPRRHGPGLGGALLLDRNAPPFPALTARRTAPLRWSGPWRPLAPESLLLRVGLLASGLVADERVEGGLRPDRPWFFQWLVRWRVTDWCRLGCTHTAMAVPRDGTLWPDLLRINLPTAGTTWREQREGPETDRVFAAQLEFRWRDAPWPWLPATAGRAWWEYAGTDFLPRGPGGIFPEISAPASVAGCELLSPGWDLAAEYAETLHPLVLWYANGSFPSGYTHDGWLLGHELGGAGERLAAIVRWRSAAGGGTWYGECGLTRASWGQEGHTPALARERTLMLAAGPLCDGAPGRWRARVDWRRSEVVPRDGAGAQGRRDDWSLALERRF